MIQLHRLEGFYWVAKVGGYSKAARAFPYPITQPAVHQQVKKLEEELGISLFERVGRDSIMTTPAGKKLQDFVAPFFEGLPAVLRSICGGEHGGEVHVLAQSFVLRDLMPAWVQRLYQTRPETLVHLHEYQELDVEPLMTGDVDFVVGHFMELPPSIAYTEIGMLYPYLAVPRGHRLARKKNWDWSELEGETFISYSPGHFAHGLQVRLLEAKGVKPGHIISAGASETILGFVEAGLGFSLLASVGEDAASTRPVVVKPLKLPEHEYPVYMAWRKDTPENPMLDALIETAPNQAP